MPAVAKLIQQLGLQRHPEGGYYKETFRDSHEVREAASVMPDEVTVALQPEPPLFLLCRLPGVPLRLLSCTCCQREQSPSCIDSTPASAGILTWVRQDALVEQCCHAALPTPALPPSLRNGHTPSRSALI